ncbi:MAG: DUF4231 domain-containing protein [Actinophytocola sp.]|nr:DUF4231 domain-containing protein [Actinophytocola sp.]
MASDRDESQDLRDRAFAHWGDLQKNWRRRALRSKRTSKLFVYASVLLSVGTTAMSGIPMVPRWWVVIVSAGAALAAALLTATKAQEQWVLSREVQNHLYAERFLFEQRAGIYDDAGLADDRRTRLFSARIASIGMAGHNSWAGARHRRRGRRGQGPGAGLILSAPGRRRCRPPGETSRGRRPSRGPAGRRGTGSWSAGTSPGSRWRSAGSRRR